MDALNSIAGNYLLEWRVIENCFVTRQLSEEIFYLSRAKSYCDCGTVLGRGDERYTVNHKDLKKLRKKGWSQTKIERWISDKNKDLDKRASGKGNPETKEWIEFINATIADTSIGKFGLLLHWYSSGSSETEHIKIKSIEKIHIKDVNPEFIMRIKEDTYYLFEKWYL
ncbi:hypothetical protein ACFL35_17495 [Candidatus Riflebacteria bacterium]